eukprot:CAMPEP_0202915666 /NCGR_PEP_ID=MMETSP1392-20130828/66299_1 /ASSEMBLY_ACC=CAM_ASM_000868 /TAXON_ID=225041 /ORGANISM="Chlamydomonas chlamydogama, Strain SAG 11-48b" /LENGTH=136 /DNA_ID=CAMNT_0049607785 /DNA_START=25 /DNA_END=436 /DNA_ORIENTATION=-
MTGSRDTRRLARSSLARRLASTSSFCVQCCIRGSKKSEMPMTPTPQYSFSHVAMLRVLPSGPVLLQSHDDLAGFSSCLGPFQSQPPVAAPAHSTAAVEEVAFEPVVDANTDVDASFLLLQQPAVQQQQPLMSWLAV